MIYTIFRKTNSTNTTGVWFARIDRDLKNFCNRVYGNGVRLVTHTHRTFSVRSLSINFINYTIHVFWEL